MPLGKSLGRQGKSVTDHKSLSRDHLIGSRNGQVLIRQVLSNSSTGHVEPQSLPQADVNDGQLRVPVMVRYALQNVEHGFFCSAAILGDKAVDLCLHLVIPLSVLGQIA